MKLDPLSILLVHIRPDDMRDHEYELVKKFSGLTDGQINRYDVFKDIFSLSILDGVDAVIIGGSGDYLLSQGHIPEEIVLIQQLILKARESGIPILGICFGAQILVQALGGVVERDIENQETGTYTINKNEHSSHCPIFSELPSAFDAQLGHQDHIKQLPPKAINLASSDLCAIQAFTMPGESIYGITFHPELDEAAICHRLDYYAGKYGITPHELVEMKSVIRPTPDAIKLISLFLNKVVIQGNKYPEVL